MIKAQDTLDDGHPGTWQYEPPSLHTVIELRALITPHISLGPLEGSVRAPGLLMMPD